MGLADKYCDLINDNLGANRFFATWLPTMPMFLGDYGVLDDDVFIKQGNIRDFEISFQAELGNVVSDFSYKSNGVKITNIDAGFGGFVNVGAKFNSTKKFDTLFSAKECQQSLMLSQPAILKKVKTAFQANNMKNFHIVTEVLKAKTTTILIASEKNAEFAIEASTSQPLPIDITNPTVGFTVKSSSNMGFSVVGSQGLTPLVALSKIPQ